MVLVLNVIRDDEYLIVSWNVNGYSADVHEWLKSYVNIYKPDIVFLSETKKKSENLPFLDFPNYNFIINVHVPAMWHGVAMLIRKEHKYEQIPVNLGIPVRSDNKSNDAGIGRLIVIRLNDKLNIIGSYTPNSGNSDVIKHTYRVRTWDPAFFNVIKGLKELGPTLWIGDINVAFEDIDVSDPRAMKGYAGFTEQERSNIKSLVKDEEWIDVWRKQHPHDKIFTWVGKRRSPYSYGMRLDNIIASKDLYPMVTNSFMIPQCAPSADHIPICVCVSK